MNFTKKDLDGLNKEELTTLLKELKTYSDLKKFLGERGKDLYHQVRSGRKIFVVEYFPSLERGVVEEKAVQIYKDVFSESSVTLEEIVFRENEKIQGGMRVFLDDKVLDLSYLKIENKFSK